MAESILFTDEGYSEVIKIANELGELEKRKPTDSLKLLILDEGQRKIDQLKAKLKSQDEQ